jgi:hypothetical protein
MAFLRLLTKPPLRPFSRFARCLASLRTSPPNLPSATVAMMQYGGELAQNTPTRFDQDRQSQFPGDWN